MSAPAIQTRPLPAGSRQHHQSQSPLLSGIEGKRVKITGRIEMYKEKPEIRINAASQLEIE
jgi:DNA/RNA endonuclease YhcR with UshA esterase domain